MIAAIQRLYYDNAARCIMANPRRYIIAIQRRCITTIQQKGERDMKE